MMDDVKRMHSSDRTAKPQGRGERGKIVFVLNKKKLRVFFALLNRKPVFDPILNDGL